MTRDRGFGAVWAAVAGVAIAVRFLVLAGAGLRAGFSHDDLMNIYLAWDQPLGRLIGDNVLFFGRSCRPMGALLYRSIYTVAGFRPLAFHLAAFALLAANLFLLYAFARRLTGSREVALGAAFLASFHGAMCSLYYDTGMMYDLLCFCFFFAALVWHLRIRQYGRRLGGLQIAVLIALQVAALNAKEMAAALPVILAAYEWWWEPRRDWRAVGATVLVTAVGAVGKMAGAIGHNPNYAVDPSPAVLLRSLAHYGGLLLYHRAELTTITTVALAAGLFGLAWLSRNRVLKFGAVFAIAGLLPVAFIPLRPGFVLYLPAAGLAIYLASLAVWAIEKAAKAQWARVVALLALAAAADARLWRTHVAWRDRSMAPTIEAQEAIRKATEGVAALHVKAGPGTSILLLNDPFPNDFWSIVYVVKLHLRQPGLAVQMAKQFKELPPIEQYSVVIDYRDGTFRDVTPARKP